MSRCETRSGQYQCKSESGHKDDHGNATPCETDAAEYNTFAEIRKMLVKQDMMIRDLKEQHAKSMRETRAALLLAQNAIAELVAHPRVYK